MAFKAALHENILFPVPYAENEQHRLIITNKRIVQRSDAGEVEVATDDIHTVSRSIVRPRAPIGIMLIVLALPLVGFGAYEVYDVWGRPMASPMSLFSSATASDDGTTAAPPDPSADGGDQTDPDYERTNLLTKLLGYACIAAAAGLALGARSLIRKKRYFVLARGAQRFVKMEVKDEIQQTQVMVTVSAVKGKAK
ncbi:MAG TPA: hypothetical protein VIA18_02195 [Polyangia bacterium]|jgi:hypothetical protein|nr:hypothetical protein [Polyangia bacterium]HWE31711.1 hypothetical protein [Polyangia bacterium]